MNTQTLSLDVSKRSPAMQVVHLGQGDLNGTTLQAAMYDNGEPLALAGYDVYLNIVLPDGVHGYRKQGSVSGSTATVVVDETEAASVPGTTHDAYLTVEQAGTVVASTGRFTVACLRGIGDLPASSWYPGIDELEDRAEALDAQVERARQEITAAQAVAAGYVVSVGGDVDGTTLVLGATSDVEALAVGLANANEAISALESELDACCAAATSDLARAFLLLASLVGAWQYVAAAECVIAPSAASMSVSGTTATVAGTVSGTTLTLTDAQPSAASLMAAVGNVTLSTPRAVATSFEPDVTRLASGTTLAAGLRLSEGLAEREPTADGLASDEPEEAAEAEEAEDDEGEAREAEAAEEAEEEDADAEGAKADEEMQDAEEGEE